MWWSRWIGWSFWLSTPLTHWKTTHSRNKGKQSMASTKNWTFTVVSPVEPVDDVVLPTVGDIHNPILVCRYSIAQAQLSAQILHQLLVLHDLLPDRQTHAHWDRDNWDTMTYLRIWNIRGRGVGALSLQFVVVFWFLRKTTRLYLLNILEIKPRLCYQECIVN